MFHTLERKVQPSYNSFVLKIIPQDLPELLILPPCKTLVLRIRLPSSQANIAISSRLFR